jgi:hypothetical protein
MIHAPLRRTVLRAVVLAIVALPVVASSATADQFFHTSHADLTPIGGAPLQSGFVNDIHTNGVTISAEERYQLNGAMPDTTYSVALHISAPDPTCTDFVFKTATFTTNASGNGEAGFTFRQASPPPPPNPRTIYIRWVVSTGGVPQYQTDCVPVVVGA